MPDLRTYLLIQRNPKTKPALPREDEVKDALLDRMAASHYAVELLTYRVGVVRDGKTNATQPVLLTKRVDGLSTWLMAAFKARSQLACSIWVCDGPDRKRFLDYDLIGSVVGAVTWTGDGVKDQTVEHVRFDCSGVSIGHGKSRERFEVGT